MEDLIIFDAHCDTITKLMDNHQNLYDNQCHFDIKRSRKYKGYIQVFAAWIDSEKYSFNPLQRCMQIIDTFYRHIEKYQSSLCFVKNINEAMEAVYNHKVAAFLSVEGGEALQGDLSVLRMLYQLGVRSIVLTWNGRNEIGDGVEERTGGGLTNFGIEVVKEMNRLKMIIDLSHLAPKGFWDVIEYSSQPIIASHSNAKTICNHVRNLTDEQFKAIIEKQGVVGINLCPDFLNNSSEKADLNDIIKHIEHFMSLGGENHIGIGADFDGIDSTPQSIKGVENLEQIFESLLRLNYTEMQVKKIASNNFIRVFSQILS